MHHKYSFKEIQTKINIGIGMLFKNDSFLLETGVNERSVSHKLGEYLQKQFPDWHVDCEYNKKGNVKKKLDGIREYRRSESDIVYPDIIIHQRNTKNNLLIIEIKTNDDSTICDIAKLELFTSDPEYKYDFGLFIKFNSVSKPNLIWYENGSLK